MNTDNSEGPRMTTLFPETLRVLAHEAESVNHLAELLQDLRYH
jgi:hypothetical protein